MGTQHEVNAAKLATFDAARFADDVERHLKAHGKGARWRMEQRAGLNHATIARFFKLRKICEVDAIMSICAYLSLSVGDYATPRDECRYAATPIRVFYAAEIDWELLRACAALFCGENAAELSHRTRLPYPIACEILRTGRCRSKHFHRLLAILKLEPHQLHPRWRATKRAQQLSLAA